MVAFVFLNLVVTAFINFFLHTYILVNTKQKHKLLQIHFKAQSTIQTNFDVCCLDYNHKIKGKKGAVSFACLTPDCIYKVNFLPFVTLCPRFLPLIQGATYLNYSLYHLIVNFSSVVLW